MNIKRANWPLEITLKHRLRFHPRAGESRYLFSCAHISTSGASACSRLHGNASGKSIAGEDLTCGGGRLVTRLVRLSSGTDNSRDAPPYLRGTSDLRVSSKVKGQAEAVEIDRTRPAAITLARGTKVPRAPRG